MPRLARPKYGDEARKYLKRHRSYKYVVRIPFGSISLREFELKAPFKLPFFVDVSPGEHPDKQGLMTVQEFFKYTEQKSKPFIVNS